MIAARIAPKPNDGAQAFCVEQQADERIDQLLDDHIDDCGECRANDNGDGKVDHIPSENELLESLDHGNPPQIGASG